MTSQAALSQTDAPDEVLETRIAADRVKVGVDLHPLQDCGFFFIGLFEGGEGLFIIPEPQVGIHKGSCGNVACAFAPFQVRQQPKRVVTAAGMGIGADEHPGNPRAPFGQRECLLQNRDCLGGLIIGNERESQVSTMRTRCSAGQPMRCAIRELTRHNDGTRTVSLKRRCQLPQRGRVHGHV